MAQENRPAFIDLEREILSPGSEMLNGALEVTAGILVWRIGSRGTQPLDLGLQVAGGAVAFEGLINLGRGGLRSLKGETAESRAEANLMSELMPGIEELDLLEGVRWTFDQFGRPRDIDDKVYGLVLKDGQVTGGARLHQIGRDWYVSVDGGALSWQVNPVKSAPEIAVAITKARIGEFVRHNIFMEPRDISCCSICADEEINQLKK